MTDRGHPNQGSSDPQVTARAYEVIAWRGNEPHGERERLTILADSLQAARSVMEAKYGAEYRFSIWNEDDARRPRT